MGGFLSPSSFLCVTYIKRYQTWKDYSGKHPSPMRKTKPGPFYPLVLSTASTAASPRRSLVLVPFLFFYPIKTYNPNPDGNFLETTPDGMFLERFWKPSLPQSRILHPRKENTTASQVPSTNPVKPGLFYEPTCILCWTRTDPSPPRRSLVLAPSDSSNR